MIKIKIEFFGRARLIADQEYIYIETAKQIKEIDLTKIIASAKPALLGEVIDRKTYRLKKSYNFGINGIKNVNNNIMCLNNDDSILIFSSQSGG